MRILHVENVAGVGSALSRAQRGLGHESDVLITWPNRFEFEVDHEHVYQGKGMRLPSEMVKVLRTCRSYDVLHVHGGLTRKRIDILLSRMTTKQILVGHYHGSETRQGYGLHYRRFIDLGVVATPDLLRWLPDIDYVPNPVDTARKQTQFTGIHQAPRSSTFPRTGGSRGRRLSRRRFAI